MRFNQFFFGAAVAIGLAAGVAAGPAAAQQNVWDKVQSSGKMVVGVLADNKPGVWKEGNTYEGFYVNFARDIADKISVPMGKKITLDFAESSFATVVLDLQSGKIDIWSGMSATEERKKALDMAGPMYDLAHCYVNRKGLTGLKTWEDYNKPSIRVTTQMGTSDEKAIQELSPKATLLSMKTGPETILAIQAGRADAIGTSVLSGLRFLQDDPGLFGEVVFPTPIRSLPSSAGIRRDGDGRFHKFVQAWADKARADGTTKRLMSDAIKKAGMNPDLLPAGFSF